jgi:lysozyme
MRFRAVVICGAFLAAVAFVAALLLYGGVVRFNYPSFDRYPVQGVDVSHHQGRINWAELRGRRAQFAYIKASEGAAFRDPRFAENWSAALAAGVVPGAYHFFTLCTTGEEQAANFLSVVAAAVDASSLPPAVDLEFGGNCERRPSTAEFRAELSRFLVLVEKRLGCRPVLYVTREFYPYVAGGFLSHPLWVRDIFMRPRLEDGRPWRIWQFANRGTLAGVATFIDLNVFDGSTEDFAAFRCGKMQP